MVVPCDIWQDPFMRQPWVWAGSIAAIGLLSGCGGEPVQAESPTDVLVLEVGGTQPSLRASLTSMGRTVAPGHVLRPRPVVDPNPEARPEARPEGSGGREFSGPQGPGRDDPRRESGPAQEPPEVTPDRSPEQQPAPEPTPPPLSEWVVVKLPKNETLTHLSLRYLGTGARFQEIMKWNGWNDADARRLRTGQDVKLKRSEMR
tara:strand:- start:29063 stop:29671 length:609 start_codon:yes stop_codon:yes gene_type:complete